MSTDTIIPPDATKPNKKKSLITLPKDLSQRAIVIKLTIGGYTGQKKDIQAGSEVAHDNNADIKRIKVDKKLLKSDELDNVNAIAQKMRQYFYKKTVPWTREGEGVLSTKKFIEEKQALEQFKREYYAAVDKLVDRYDDLVKNDKEAFGDLYKESDYPSKSSFRSKFYVDIQTLPLEKSDFRCNILGDAEVDEINRQIEERIINAHKAAQRDLLVRIQERLVNLLARLSDGDKRFRGSNFTNLFETLDDVSELNISEDQSLDQLIGAIATNLSVFDADIIKKSEKKRNEAIDETKAALDKINESLKDFM